MDIEREKHIYKLLTKIDDYKLEVAQEFHGTSVDLLVLLYNGAGPDFFPEWIRKKLTDYLSFFEPAFLPHDWEYVYMPKTKEKFYESNMRLLRNCKRIIFKEIAIWRILAILRRLSQAKLIHFACDTFGLASYMEKKTYENII